MKKLTIFSLMVLGFMLAGCTIKPGTQNNNSNQGLTNNNVNQPAVNQQNTNTQQNNNQSDEITKKTDEEFLIPEVGIKIVFPDEYTITKDNEKNRRGSFVSYNFNYKNPLPTFNEIQFFNEESIRQFTANCGDTPCFFGDYPDLKRYNGQKNAFNAGNDYGEYKLKKFGDRNYFVSSFRVTGDSGIIREYTTFIDDTKVDISIAMTDNTQVNAADSLFKKFKIID